MDKTKHDNNIFSGTGYVLGLLFGIAIIIAFAVGFGATFIGIGLGLSFSLCFGISLECKLVEGKRLSRTKKVLLVASCIILMLSIFSLFYFDEMM